MNGLSCLLWGIELILELLGARYAYRRRIRPVGNFLAFSALSDLLCLQIIAEFGPKWHFWCWYGQRVIQYILFAQLVMYLCAKMMGDDKKTTRFYFVGSAMLVGIAIVFFHLQPFTMTNVMHFAAATYFLAGVCLCLALLGQETESWTWMGIAALILAVSNGLLSAMQAQHLPVMAYYPIGEIAALATWLIVLIEKKQKVAPVENMPESEPEFVLSLDDENWLRGIRVSL